NQFQEFQKAGADFRRVQDLLKVQPQITDGEGAMLPSRLESPAKSKSPSKLELPPKVALPVASAEKPPIKAHSLTFVNVSFSYGDQELLQGINFHLKPGESLGLLGRTGSGKTTLTRLLFRLYDPQEGKIELDGVDVRQLTLKTLRKRVGLVTQDVQLFRGTVRENLTFFDPSITDEKIY